MGSDVYAILILLGSVGHSLLSVPTFSVSVFMNSNIVNTTEKYKETEEQPTIRFEGMTVNILYY